MRAAAAGGAFSTSADRAIGDVAAIVSHDMNALVRHISIFSEELCERVDPDHEAVEIGRRISERADQIRELAGRLVEYAHISAAPPRLARTPLCDLVGAAANDNGGLHVLCEERVEVLADPRLIGVAFRCLIENAARHGGETARTVRFTAAPRDDRIQILCADDGVGFDARIAARAFEPFTRSATSVGLGLPLCRNIVENHGGAIWIAGADAADPPPQRDAGARVAIELPADISPAQSLSG